MRVRGSKDEVGVSLPPSRQSRATSLVRGRHCWGKVPLEMKLLRSEVAFGSEAAYGCEVASQRNGGEGGTVKTTPHHRVTLAWQSSLIIAGLGAELLMYRLIITELGA